MKQEGMRELFDTIRAKVRKEAVFILVISDDENGGLVSNLGSAEEVARVLRTVADEQDAGRLNVRGEADGSEREARGSGGH